MWITRAARVRLSRAVVFARPRPNVIFSRFPPSLGKILLRSRALHATGEKGRKEKKKKKKEETLRKRKKVALSIDVSRRRAADFNTRTNRSWNNQLSKRNRGKRWEQRGPREIDAALSPLAGCFSLENSPSILSPSWKIGRQNFRLVELVQREKRVARFRPISRESRPNWMPGWGEVRRGEARVGEEAIISQFIPVARGSQRRTMPPLSLFMRGRREHERAGSRECERAREAPSANTCSECVVWLG